MSTRRTWRRIGREWLIGLMAYSLLVAPFGCELQTQLTLPPGGTGAVAGFFLNTSAGDDVVAAGRNAQGDAFFVYGQRDGDGELTRVDAIVVRTAAGEEAFVRFELGRPVHLEGPDGSHVRIDYTEVSEDRLAADIAIFDAATGTTETTSADVDLAQVRADLLAAAQDAADTLEGLTGQRVEVPEVDDIDTAKVGNRALPIVAALAFIPLVALVQLTIAIMGQVMSAVFAAVGAALQAAVIAALAPVILLGSLMGEVAVNFNSLPLVEIFIELPSRPQG